MGPGLTVEPTYDMQDRLLTYGSNVYEYTLNGELKEKQDPSGRTSYEYDAMGMLKTVTLPGGVTIAYVLDAAGRRVGEKVDGALVQGFVYDPANRIVAELDADGEVVTRFLYASRQNSPDYMIKGGVAYRMISDQLGSVRLVVDAATGTSVAQRLDYDEFGRVAHEEGAADFQPFGYAGGLYDRGTGLVHFGVREYDPDAGRWSTKDPMGFGAGDTNLYGYAVNDPMNVIDPSGMWAITDPVIVNAAAGFGDGISLGMTAAIREILGTNDMVDFGSGAYWGSFAAGLGLTAAGYATGAELAIGSNWRFAPWGNRTGDPYGELPHYHRRGWPDPEGDTPPGQGIGRHRPWEPKSPDKHWCDRF